MKLMTKLSISIVIIALIGFTTIGGLAFLKTQTIVSEEVEDLTGIIVEGLADNISNTMAQYRIASNILAKSEVVKAAYRTGDYDPLLIEFENFVSEFPNVTNIYIGYNNKDFPIYPFVELPEDYDPTARPWFTNAKDAGEEYWVDPYINAMDRTLIVSLAIPIYDGSLDFIGVLSMDINLSSLNDQMNEKQISGSGYPILVDTLGMTMTHKVAELVGIQVPIPELANAITNNEDGRVRYQFNGANKFASFSTVKETGWRVLVVLSNDEISDEVAPLLPQMFIVSLITIIAMFVTVNLIAGKFKDQHNDNDLDY